MFSWIGGRDIPPTKNKPQQTIMQLVAPKNTFALYETTAIGLNKKTCCLFMPIENVCCLI